MGLIWQEGEADQADGVKGDRVLTTGGSRSDVHRDSCRNNRLLESPGDHSIILYFPIPRYNCE